MGGEGHQPKTSGPSNKRVVASGAVCPRLPNDCAAVRRARAGAKPNRQGTGRVDATATEDFCRTRRDANGTGLGGARKQIGERGTNMSSKYHNGAAAWY
jgi:hypothetical protein